MSSILSKIRDRGKKHTSRQEFDEDKRQRLKKLKVENNRK